MKPLELKEHDRSCIARAILKAPDLTWDGAPTRVEVVRRGATYAVGQRTGVIEEGAERGAGSPPEGEGMPVLVVEGRKAAWLRFGRKDALRVAQFD